MMSTVSKKSSDDTVMMCCASCGIAEVDDIKLKDCDGGCDLVKYCSNGCQELHRPEHAGECKKRLAELRERDLFMMPDSSCLGDCPICCLPLSIDTRKCRFMDCCSKVVCMGCDYANQKREIEAGLELRCVFCREPQLKSLEEADKNTMTRVKKNNSVAMCFMGVRRYDERDYDAAFKYLIKAAELGDAYAHYQLSDMYYHGQGVQKDEKREVYHWEQAAIAGHPAARHNLGFMEWSNGNFERAKKHWIIAANLGEHDSLKNLRALYAKGHASKEDYANALRAYQAALEATKSAERDEAEKAIKSGKVRYYAF